MEIKKCVKKSFSIIGKEGSTEDGDTFIKDLWKDANLHFNEIEPLAKRDGNGDLVGIWGAMSDFSRSFKPWSDNFSKGLYLAGVECDGDAKAPEGWTKWTIPSYEYIYVEVKDKNTFRETINYFNANNIGLVGAVHDFTCPKNGKNYMFFPINKM